MINEIITIDGNDYQIIENYNDKLYLTKEVGKRNLFYYWSSDIIEKIKRKLLSHKEKRKIWSRTFYENHREEIIERVKKYNKLNRENINARLRATIDYKEKYRKESSKPGYKEKARERHKKWRLKKKKEAK